MRDVCPTAGAISDGKIWEIAAAVRLPPLELEVQTPGRCVAASLCTTGDLQVPTLMPTQHAFLTTANWAVLEERVTRGHGVREKERRGVYSSGVGVGKRARVPRR